MANYEFMFIVDTSLSEEDRNTSIWNLKSILEKFSAKIAWEEVIGEKKLSYKINGSSTGYYIILDLEMNWENIKEISKEINLERTIWRYMFVSKES
jgi:small subunit ribosomal protein S6